MGAGIFGVNTVTQAPVRNMSIAALTHQRGRARWISERVLVYVGVGLNGIPPLLQRVSRATLS